jgi:hypothetical protein
MKKHRLTPGRLFWLFQHNQKRGWRTAWQEYVVLPKIWNWKPDAHWPVQTDVEVHLLTSQEYASCAAWMIASLFHQTQRQFQVVVHEDGSFDDETANKMETWLPGLRVIRRSEADQSVNAALAGFPECQALRRRFPLSIKLFDVPVFCKTERLLLIDSDVLFLKRPLELIRWLDANDESNWFNPDFQHSCNVTVEQAREKWGIDLWPKVNSGLALLRRDIFDFAFCEECLREGTVLSQGWEWTIEQTLIALCASRHGKGGLLPETYEVSFNEQARPDSVARHYVGHVRQQFYSEGVRRLHRVLLG